MRHESSIYLFHVSEHGGAYADRTVLITTNRAEAVKAANETPPYGAVRVVYGVIARGWPKDRSYVCGDASVLLAMDRRREAQARRLKNRRKK